MTIYAADLLQRSLSKTRSAPDARVPAADILAAFEELIARQEDVYDQIILPELGIGERFDVRAHQLFGTNLLGNGLLDTDLLGADAPRHYRGGEVWLFDASPAQNWLHAPFLVPFEDIEDTLILARASDLPVEVARQLRPPLIPGVRRALEALDWLVVDTGGYEGGRMEHDEFLDEIGDRPWVRIDHDPESGATRFETWCGQQAQSGWSTNLFDAFEHLGDDPDSPAQLYDKSWPQNPDERAFEIAVALDLLADPYAICRRLIFQDAGLDIDRLGPLVTWKDSPDMLFEFTDEDDSHLTDVGRWMASKFGRDPVYFSALIDDWFAQICEHLPVEIPGLGVLHEITVPALTLRRPRTLLGRMEAGSTILAPVRVLAATSRPSEEWVEPR